MSISDKKPSREIFIKQFFPLFLMAVRKKRGHPLSSTSSPLDKHISQERHAHRVHHLLYIITLLLIVLVFAVFFTFPFAKDSTPQDISATSFVSIDSVSCKWENDHYVLCETVTWGGSAADYAKGYIPSGSDEMSPAYTTSPFTYCQPTGTTDGYRVARALLYSDAGVIRDIGEGIECTGATPIQQPPQPPAKPTTFTTTTGFRTYPDRSTGTGEGVFTKTFPGKVQSCAYTGTWITDNDRVMELRNTCHEAQGSFTGYADFSTQYVDNDPDLYRWAGPSQSYFNPSPVRHDNYGFWMEACDTEYYAKRHISRFGVSGAITGFGTNTLSFAWTYYDKNTKPSVDFTFSLTCTLLPA